MSSEILIELVRNHECLYDITSKNYRDQQQRQEAWEQIGNELKITGEDAKTMWGKLRNSFINAKKRRKTKSGQAASKIPTWKYEKEMSFLIPFLECRITKSNLVEESERRVEEEENSIVEEDEEDVLLSKGIEEATQMETPKSDVIRKKKHLPLTPAHEMVQIMKANADLRKSKYLQKDISKQPNEMDETDMFYLSMAKTVKKLHPIEQATIRMELCKLVSEAEIRQMRAKGGSSHSTQYSYDCRSPMSSISNSEIPSPATTPTPTYLTLGPVKSVLPATVSTTLHPRTSSGTTETAITYENTLPMQRQYTTTTSDIPMREYYSTVENPYAQNVSHLGSMQ